MEALELVLALRGLGLSQKEVADLCGLSQGAISHIETGRRKNVFSVTQKSLERAYSEALGGRARSSNRSSSSFHVSHDAAMSEGEAAGASA